MVLNTNLSSMSASNNLSSVASKMYSSIEKVSSGLRINKASDDASGLAIADKLRTQVSSYKQSMSNAINAISLLQIADKAMDEQSKLLDVIKQKLVQGAGSGMNEDEMKITSEFIAKMLNQFDEIALQTRFQDKYLLQKDKNDMGKTVKIEFVLGDLAANNVSARDGVQSNTKGLGSIGGLSLESLKDDALSDAGIDKEDFRKYLAVIDEALTQLNGFRSDYGSVQNQVESTSRNLFTQKNNMMFAESVVRDVDYAEEMMNLKQSIFLYQAGSFALTQANMSKSSILDMFV